MLGLRKMKQFSFVMLHDEICIKEKFWHDVITTKQKEKKK